MGRGRVGGFPSTYPRIYELFISVTAYKGGPHDSTRNDHRKLYRRLCVAKCRKCVNNGAVESAACVTPVAITVRNLRLISGQTICIRNLYMYQYLRMRLQMNWGILEKCFERLCIRLERQRRHMVNLQTSTDMRTLTSKDLRHWTLPRKLQFKLFMS